MQTLEQQLKNATTQVCLDASEKDGMRERLVLYMEYKPLRNIQTKHTLPRVSLFPSFFRAHHLTGALAIALIVTTTTFSVSSAASGALPGDLLYPVKVDINEEIKSAFITSEEGRIAWESERAGRRLEEAGQLASEGKLDGERQAEVERRFTAHTEAVVEQVRNIEASDPLLAAEASTDLKEALDTHEAVLARLIVEHTDTVDENARNLVQHVHATAGAVQQIRDEAEEKIALPDTATTPNGAIASSTFTTNTDSTSSVGAEVATNTSEDGDSATMLKNSSNLERATHRAQTRAQEQLERAETLLTKLSENPELLATTKTQIETAKNDLREGEEALQNGTMEQAYTIYRDAVTKLQKTIQLVEAANTFGIALYADPLPTDDTIESSTTKSGTRGGVEATVGLQDVEKAHANAKERLEVAREYILAANESGDDSVAGADALTKNAAATILRGEISVNLGEYAVAQRLFTDASSQVDRAMELLRSSRNAPASTSVEASTTDSTSTPPDQTDKKEVMQDMNDATNTATTTGVISVRHTFHSGTHTLSGELTVAPCTQLSSKIASTDTFPENMTLLLEATTSADCTSTSTVAHFVATTSASESATLSGVFLDGKEREWKITDGDTGDTEDVHSSSTPIL